MGGMGARGWLGLADLPRADADGVVAESTLRAELRPRVVQAATRILRAEGPAHAATALERACWARVQAVSDVIEAGQAEAALAAVAGLEQWVEGVLW